MSYIGVQPTAGQYRKLDNISSGFNGSTTSFTTSVSGTNVTAGTAQQLLVSLGGVIQQPDTDYTVSTNTITFTTAPTSGLTFFAVLMGDALNTVTTSDGAITTAKLAGSLSVGLAAGTASAPSLYFTGDTNTGIYSLGADQVAISTGGTGRLFVDSSGRVGIGTSSVTNSLHVVGTGDAVARLAATSDTNLTFSETTANKHWNIKPSAGDFYVQYSGTAYNSGYSSLVTIKNTGAVGIGVTSPGKRLEVSDGTVTGGLDPFAGGSSFTLGTSTNHSLRFDVNSAERARIDTSGRLLVGTSSERGSAYISTARLAALFERAGGYNGITIAANENGSGGSYISLLKSRGTTTGSNTLVASGDNLGGISFEGTDGTAPCQAAGIFTYVDGTPGAGDMPGRLVFSTTADGASSPTERMRISQNGALTHYSSATPSATFENTNNVSGAGVFRSLIGSNGNNTSSYHFRGNTDSVSNWYLYGNGTTSYSSDERLKKNIESTRDGYLDDLKRLRVVKYNWKNQEDGTPKELGLIAQEVEQVFPGLVQDDLAPVSGDDHTVYKQLKGSVLPVMLLKALQEAADKIETLEAKIAALESA